MALGYKMSTILKALQKVEPETFGPGSVKPDSMGRESVNQELDRAGRGDSEPMARRAGKRDTSHWLQLSGKGRKFVILILIVLAIVGLWYYFQMSGSVPGKQPVQTFPIVKKPETHPVAKQAEPEEKATSKSQDDSGQDAPDRGAPEQVVSDQIAQNQDTEDSSPIFGTEPSSKPSQKGESTAERGIGDTSAKQSVIAPKRNRKAQRATADAKRETTQKSKPANTATAKPSGKKRGESNQPTSDNRARWQDAKRIENDRMMLQALAWSPEPEKRMGVIDGLVVREGDDANGFIVVAIQKQNIILQRDGQYFRLEFKSR